MPKIVSDINEILNYVFAAIFTIEAIIKITAFGKLYFKDNWNVFDFIIVVGTAIAIILSNSISIAIGPQTSILRAFRIGRVFRLIKKAKSLKMIFNTMVITIPALANVGGLLLLLLYMYSVLGVFIFAATKLNNALTEHANYQNFGSAFLALVRISTGEAWNELLNSSIKENSILFSCVEEMTYE